MEIESNVKYFSDSFSYFLVRCSSLLTLSFACILLLGLPADHLTELLVVKAVITVCIKLCKGHLNLEHREIILFKKLDATHSFTCSML